MKFKLLFATLFAGLVLSACAKNEGQNPGGVEEGEPKSVFLKINTNTAKTRANEPTQYGETAVLKSAVVYFIGDTPQKVFAAKTVGNNADYTLAQLEAGVEFDQIPNAVSHVYIVGNYNSSDAANNSTTLPVREGTLLSDVKASVYDIQQVSFPKLADGTTSTQLLAVLDGIAPVIDYSTNPNGWTGAGTPGEKDGYANVAIAPINARIELQELTYEGDLTSFSLGGIFINKYYATLPLGLDLAGRNVTDNGSTGAHYEVGNADFKYNDYSTLYDDVTIAAQISGGEATIKPASDIWAYHVFGNHQPVPHIVIKITDVVDGDNVNHGTRYLTVKGFREEGVALTTLERGNLYRIRSLAFDDEDLTILPETDDISIWVQVEVVPWNTVDVEGIL